MRTFVFALLGLFIAGGLMIAPLAADCCDGSSCCTGAKCCRTVDLK